MDLSERHQEIIGFGGGITDSAAQNILALSAETRSNLMRSYFGQSGRRIISIPSFDDFVKNANLIQINA